MDTEERRREAEHKRKMYWLDPDKERERMRKANAKFRAKPGVREKRIEYNREYRKRQKDILSARAPTKDAYEPTRPRPECCEACGEHKRLVLDHNHTTGNFRAWLCSSCNKALGLCKDNATTLRKLALLLEQ
jgi:hypothetical protein